MAAKALEAVNVHNEGVKAVKTAFTTKPNVLMEAKADQGDAFTAIKGEANALLKSGDLEAALVKYGEALALCSLTRERHDDGAIVLSNRALVLTKLKRHGEALADAERAVVLNPKYFKAYHRMGKALEAMGRPTEAAEALAKATQLSKSLLDTDTKPRSSEFEMLKCLGEGNFSKVYEARYKPSGEVFACKVLEKKQIESLKRRYA